MAQMCSFKLKEGGIVNQDLVLALASFVVLAWVSLVAVILGALLGGVIQIAVDTIRRQRHARALKKAILSEIQFTARFVRIMGEHAENAILQSTPDGIQRSKLLLRIRSPIWDGVMSQMASVCPQAIQQAQPFYGVVDSLNLLTRSIQNQTEKMEQSRLPGINPYLQHNVKKLICNAKVISRLESLSCLDEVQELLGSPLETGQPS